MPAVRHARRRRRLLAALACTVSSTSGLTIPMLDKAESAARPTLAKWSLEDAKLRRQVQREMRAEALREEALREEGVTTQSVDPEVSGVIQQLSSWAGRVLDEEEYRAARIVESEGAVVRPARMHLWTSADRSATSRRLSPNQSEIEEAWANTWTR